MSTRLAQLSPSLRADLQRFEHDGSASEAVEVVAACVRHAKRVMIHLQCGERVVPLTVYMNVPLFASANVSVPLPTGEFVTVAGLNA